MRRSGSIAIFSVTTCFSPPAAKPRQRFEATSRFIRDLVAHRWAKTRSVREETHPKRIYYLSMEFLLGRTLRNNMMNLAAEPIVRRAMEQEGWNLEELIEEEPDAGLGNGGLGGSPPASSTP